MEIFQFDRGEKVIERYGSAGLRATRVAAGRGEVQVTCLALAAGGVIGTETGLVALAVEGDALDLLR